MIYDFGLVFHADYDGDICLTQKFVFVDFQGQKMFKMGQKSKIQQIVLYTVFEGGESDGDLRFAQKRLFGSVLSV